MVSRRQVGIWSVRTSRPWRPASARRKGFGCCGRRGRRRRRRRGYAEGQAEAGPGEDAALPSPGVGEPLAGRAVRGMVGRHVVAEAARLVEGDDERRARVCR